MAGLIPLEWNALNCFAARGDMEAVRCILECQVSARADIREMTLVRKRIPPDSKGLYGDTSLHLAAMNGHAEMVQYLIEQSADVNAQNDMGQTPLFVASMMGQVRTVDALIMARADVHRISIDGKNALDVARQEECRFLLKPLVGDDEEEDETQRKAAAMQKRLAHTMTRWAKAPMVDAYSTWKDYALIPENKVLRVIAQLESWGKEESYGSRQDVVDQRVATNLSETFYGSQLVVYTEGKKRLGTLEGSGHPLLFGLSAAHDGGEWEQVLRAHAGEADNDLRSDGDVTLRSDGSKQGVVTRRRGSAASSASRNLESAASRDSGLSRDESLLSEEGREESLSSGGGGRARQGSVVAALRKSRRQRLERSAFVGIPGWEEGRIERPDLLLRKTYEASEAAMEQEGELLRDEFGMRSISTARQWVMALVRLLSLVSRIVTKYHYIMDDPRPGSSNTNLQLIQESVLRLADRLVKPHRTMLHGLRPQAFRGATVLSSQALVNSKEFPPNFPGAPSERRLYSSRFLHLWSWITALNNPPGYLPIPDVQETLGSIILPLRLNGHQDVEYLLHRAFQPRPEMLAHGERLHIQTLDLPLPPKYSTNGHELYYAKAICKVEGEPATEVGLRQRAPPDTLHRQGLESAFGASMPVEAALDLDDDDDQSRRQLSRSSNSNIKMF